MNSPVGAMLSQGDLEFIALNSDIDGEGETDSIAYQKSFSRELNRSPAWHQQRRTRIGLALALICLFAVFVIGVFVFRERQLPHNLMQADKLPRDKIQVWEPVTSSISTFPILQESRHQPVSERSSKGSHISAWDVQRATREKAATNWSISALPCRCNCPNGEDPPEPPSRDHIVQSASDARKHRTVLLPGGLRAFLTSDPATDFAAAAVDVGVGSADDPKQFPGLAHFLEHMLFMGSKKYPDEDEYSKFLTQNGGYDNAYTADEHTNFFFKVRAAALGDALDRFAQFFAAPLLHESSAKREVMAVDAEHHKNLNSDMWRANQLLMSQCGGRAAHFGTGDRHTLHDGSTETVMALRKFHSAHYVADNLRLAILGNASLDILESMAKSAFAHVRSGKAQETDLQKVGDSPAPCAGGFVYVMEPLGDMQTLALTFPAREMRSEKARRSAAYELLQFALSGRHEGSLYADLKREGWATSVDFSIDVNLVDISTMSINIDLTALGLKTIVKVVDLALGHLLLVVESLQKYANAVKQQATGSDVAAKVCNMWSDMEAVQALSFHFQENADPADFVSSIAANMRTSAPRDMLGSSVASELDADMTLSIVEALDSKHHLPSVWIYAKKFEGSAFKDVLSNHIEPIYGTKYRKGRLPNELVTRWMGSSAPLPPATAKLPQDSARYLPKHLSLQPVPPNHRGERQAAPKKIAYSGHDAHYSMFYKPDAEYRVPKATVKCLASTHAAYGESARAAAEARMFASSLRDALEVPLYQAALAGYSWSVDAEPLGLEITIRGYGGDTLQTLVERVAAAVKAPPGLQDDRFEALRALAERATRNERHRDLFQLGRSYLMAQALMSPHWSWSQQLKALQNLNFEVAVKRGEKIRSEATVTCLTFGDLSEDDATQLVKPLAATVVASPPRMASPLSMVAFPEQAEFTEIRSPPLVANESNSLAMLVYQLEPVHCPESHPLCPDSMKQAASMLLLSQIAAQQAFNQLRTKESLGYVVWLWPQPTPVYQAGGRVVWSLRLLVQSGVKNASYIRQRMSHFMDTLLGDFSSDREVQTIRRRLGSPSSARITDADIESAKHGLIASLLKRPDSLEDEGARLWQEIVLRREDWSRPWELATVVSSLSRHDCMQILLQALRPGSKGRKAAIEVWRSGDGDPFSTSGVLHLQDDAAMKAWKEKAGDWSSILDE